MKWNPKFSKITRYSIIDGVLYHADMSDKLKCRLVPVFKSKYCWQDLALMFMRIRDEDESSLSIIDEVERKRLDISPPSKNNNGCILF